jgi:hypothetical protein
MFLKIFPFRFLCVFRDLLVSGYPAIFVNEKRRLSVDDGRHFGLHL